MGLIAMQTRSAIEYDRMTKINDLDLNPKRLIRKRQLAVDFTDVAVSLNNDIAG